MCCPNPLKAWLVRKDSVPLPFTLLSPKLLSFHRLAKSIPKATYDRMCSSLMLTTYMHMHNNNMLLLSGNSIQICEYSYMCID